jgi:hypothetical protein
MVLLFTIGCSKGGAINQLNASYYEKTASTAVAGRAYETEALRIEYSNNSAVFANTSDINIEQQFYPEEPASSETANPTSLERKLVKRSNIRIRVESLETADSSVSGIIRKYGAYTAITEVEENSMYYSIRVPSSVYDAFQGEMNGIGKILHRSESTEDVTINYYDLEGRLAAKRELLKTYQSYLGRASNIEEILSVEARIADLQYDIERTGTQLRILANLVDYATIDLSLLGPVTATSYQRTTFGERMKELFGGFGGFLSVTGVIITGIIIYGIPVLLLLVFIYWILFGRIGLMKKLWQLVTAKKQD